VAGATYADQDANATVYTSERPPGYVELEAFSPLVTLERGQRVSLTVKYTLGHRTGQDAFAEARRVLGIGRPRAAASR
jgi:hypothetical protein